MNRLERMSPNRRVLTLVSVLAVAFVVLALAAEGAVRLRQSIKYGADFSGVEQTFHVDPELGIRTPVPGYTSDRGLSINALGFRGPELTVPKPASTIRIAFLGASTTFSAEVGDNADTWPHLVVQELQRLWPNRRFDYVNAGVPGYGLSDSLINLRMRVAPLSPDVIIIYHATNDLSFRSRRAAEAQGIDVAHGDQRLSWLAEHSMLAYLLEKNIEILATRYLARQGDRKLEVKMEALTLPFTRDLRALVEASEEVAHIVALATFSTRLRPDLPPGAKREAAVTSLYYMPYMTPDGLIDAFAAYNEAIRAVARERGDVLIDDEFRIPGDGRHFADSVHLTEAGSRIMAERVVEGLKPALAEWFAAE